MDSIIEAVAAKTGLSKSASKEVVLLVVNGLKDKLPGPVATAIDSYLGGGGGGKGEGGKGEGGKDDAGGMLGDLTKGLGKMLGGN